MIGILNDLPTWENKAFTGRDGECSVTSLQIRDGEEGLLRMNCKMGDKRLINWPGSRISGGISVENG